jgi:protein-S-isoprenylcysteine O-methyltransferase Ste14
MSLCTEFERSGSWLFRHRSFLPVAAFPIIIAAGVSYHYICRSHSLTELGQAIGLLVSFLGLGVRLLTVGYAPAGTSGRNTTVQVANQLNTTGMYSIVRHPLYLGNYLVMLGLILAIHSWIALFLATGIFCLFYERIMFAEERFLREQFSGDFESWADRTPAFVPDLSHWVKPDESFCWRTVLRREYTGFFLITSLFFLIDLVGDSIAERHLKLDLHWISLFILGLLAYFTLRSLKKYTRLLHAPGR